MKIILLIIVFLVVFGIILCIAIEPVLTDKKLRNNVVNYDHFMMNYYFLLSEDINSAINKLSRRNVKDILEYQFDEKKRIITFLYGGIKTDYCLLFHRIDKNVYMKVEKANVLPANGYISLRINSFFINKLCVKPVEYSMHQDICA